MVPDILVMGKGMGGGVPVGAFMSSAKIMKSLQYSPKLGHITTLHEVEYFKAGGILHYVLRHLIAS